MLRFCIRYLSRRVKSCTSYSDRLHDFSVSIPRCYKDVNVNSFFPRTAKLWNSLPIECFPLTYDLSGFKSRINRHLVCVCRIKRELMTCYKWTPQSKQDR